mgnify:CR=1 FL=1
MSISKTIHDLITKKSFLTGKQVAFKANDNISEFMRVGYQDLLVDEVAEKMQEVLKALVIDVENDHNTQETARRVAKMFVLELFKGRYEKPPRVTSFPNVTSYDQLYVTGPITVRSTCAHHFQNIRGKCYIGVYPGKKVIGLSKFNRIVDWIASRPQIQEEMTMQIANEIKAVTEAEGIAVLMRAEHACCTHRGVKEHESDMTTSVMLGMFREQFSLKQEFLSIVGTMK